MTGPEAIAAAERLPDRLKLYRYELLHEGAEVGALRGDLVAAADVLSTLRAALLQSQEALQAIRDVVIDAAPSLPILRGEVLMRVDAAISSFLTQQQEAKCPCEQRSSPPVALKER